MNRRSVGTFVLAGVVVLTCSAGSGGCGGSSGGGGSAPQVGAGGEQSAPKEESEPSKEASSGEHTTAEPSEEHPTDEPTEEGQASCTFAPESLKQEGNRIVGKGHMICHEEPKMLQGSLVLVFTHFQGGNWEYVEDSRISLTNLDIGKTLTVSTVCNEGYWLVLWTATGRDANGRQFTAEPYNFPQPPRKVDSCS